MATYEPPVLFPPMASTYEPRATATRMPPAPIASGISARKLPTASITQIGTTCDHWLAKSAGSGYGHPAQRGMFEMAHELKALIGPLRQEEARKDTRLRHLEEMMAQFNEVFGAGLGGGDLVSPAALAEALYRYKELTVQLKGELEKAAQAEAAHQEHFKLVLSQHHDAWQADRERQSRRHAEEVARLRDLHAAELRALALHAPEVYAEPMAAAAYNARRAAAEAVGRPRVVCPGTGRRQEPHADAGERLRR